MTLVKLICHLLDKFFLGSFGIPNSQQSSFLPRELDSVSKELALHSFFMQLTMLHKTDAIQQSSVASAP